MVTFKITRAYKVEAKSKAEALEQLRKAAAERQDTELLEFESIQVVPDAKSAGWMKTLKEQL